MRKSPAMVGKWLKKPLLALMETQNFDSTFDSN